MYLLVLGSIQNQNTETSMHYSRKRTTHLLPVFPSMHCAGGVYFLTVSVLWGVSASWGVFATQGVSANRRGVCYPGGVCYPVGYLLPGGCLLLGLCLLLEGVCYPGVSACTEADTPCEQNDRHNLRKLCLWVVINTTECM